MPQETELKLSLQAQDLPRLLRHPLLSTQQPKRQRLLNTYFDTPDLLLMQQKIAVRERRIGRRTLLTVKTAGSSVGGLSTRGEWEGSTRPGSFDFAALVDDQALASSLVALAWRLVPLFRTDFIRRSWLLDFAGAQIEVALDQGSVSVGYPTGAPRAANSLQSQPLLELELELKHGPEQALLDLAHRLSLGPDGHAASGLWLHPFHRSKAERGLDLFLGRRVQPVKATPVDLAPDMRPVQAFQCAALSCLSHLQANVSGYLTACDGGGAVPDPEFLHQARVALRRLRTGLSLFGPDLPPLFAEHWRRHWQLTASALGDARNWDVLDTELLPAWLAAHPAEPPDAEPLARWVQQQRSAANLQAQLRLRAPAHAIKLLAFTRALLALPVQAPARRQPDALARWARRSVRDRHQRLARQAARTPDQGVPGAHALRIELKKTRYAIEFLASVLPKERLRRSSALLSRAQELLGRFNDLHTALLLLAHCEWPLAERLRQNLQRQQRVLLQSLPELQHELIQARTAWDRG
jgi:inorganic triphosphatase YgiF